MLKKEISRSKSLIFESLARFSGSKSFFKLFRRKNSLILSVEKSISRDSRSPKSWKRKLPALNSLKFGSLARFIASTSFFKRLKWENSLIHLSAKKSISGHSRCAKCYKREFPAFNIWKLSPPGALLVRKASVNVLKGRIPCFCPWKKAFQEIRTAKNGEKDDSRL